MGDAGSIGITAIARAELRAQEHPDDPGKCALAMVKLNLAAYPPTLIYRKVTTEVPGVDGEHISPSMIERLGPYEPTPRIPSLRRPRHA